MKKNSPKPRPNAIKCQDKKNDILLNSSKPSCYIQQFAKSARQGRKFHSIPPTFWPVGTLQTTTKEIFLAASGMKSHQMGIHDSNAGLRGGEEGAVVKTFENSWHLESVQKGRIRSGGGGLWCYCSQTPMATQRDTHTHNNQMCTSRPHIHKTVVNPMPEGK